MDLIRTVSTVDRVDRQLFVHPAPSCAPTPGLRCGPCLTVPAQTIDTTAPVGSACSYEGDCGSVGKVCDPKTATCALSECSDAVPCAASEVCLGFGGNVDPQARACFTRCTPFAQPTCPANHACTRTTGGIGVCLVTGQAGLGQQCQTGRIETGCSAGLVCGPNGGLGSSACAPACDHFATAPGCGGGQRCVPNDFCGTLAGNQASGAHVGEACAVTGAACADDGKAYRGRCVAGNGITCRAFCTPGGPPCSAGACALEPSTFEYVCK